MVGERHPSDPSATALLDQFRAAQWQAQQTFDVAVVHCVVVDGSVTLAGGGPRRRTDGSLDSRGS